MVYKDQMGRWAAVCLIFGLLFLALGYVFLSISVNAGRIDDLRSKRERVQQKTSEIARREPEVQSELLQQQLANLTAAQDKTANDILFGDTEKHLGFAHCFLPLDPNCFHRNSSEQNNMWLAIASGALGAILFLLRALRGETNSAARAGEPTSIATLLYLVPIGMILGLLVLFLLRGTKGALLTPIADVVQVENPYGVAFACTMAGLFSDRILAWLSKLIDALHAGQQSKAEPS
jgi:hypothetical protein